MQIVEKFTDSNLFEAINEIEKLPFEGLTGLNLYWLNKYGARNVLPTLESIDIDTIASMIHDLYFSKWDRLYQQYTEKVLAEGNKSETTTRVVADSGENNSTTTSENLHKVSAFDSDDLTDENADSENRTTKDTSKNDKTETTTMSGKSGNYTNDFISYNKYLTNTQFYDMLCIDVNNTVSYGTITLDI